MRNPDFHSCKNCGNTIFAVDIHTEEDPIIYSHIDKKDCKNPEPKEKET